MCTHSSCRCDGRLIGAYLSDEWVAKAWFCGMHSTGQQESSLKFVMGNRTPGGTGRIILVGAVLACSWSIAWARDMVVVDGGPTGYSTVAEALAALRSQSLLELPSGKDLVFLEAGGKTTWTFAGKGDAAYPAFAKFVWKSSEDRVRVAISILCEAAPEPCAKFSSDMKAYAFNTLRGEPRAN